MDSRDDRQVYINVKPLSVNAAWQGRRFKTSLYKAFETEVLLKLRPITIPVYDKLRVDVTFYFKNKNSDIDNGIKPFLDILQKKYKFNDSRIYELNVKKVISKQEGIGFYITAINDEIQP